ncbi:MAG TPA: asparagine synthase (glutamine-hydrolyzing) [Dongiaceae bacterium]|nr:asparagine synthase (glutamine-hydrolyzing) [Dongiaceae bacterium]
MCGIAGIFDSDAAANVAPQTVEQMCSVIRHRGPDDQGVHCHGQIGLGVRRLSIIGVATGHMPIHNEDKSISVVFNGEIYNFADLRVLLESRGHHFYTSSDTEVIVHLYEDHGDDLVKQLRGMFAFALWDSKLHRLLLVRDRLGIKPLYYWHQGSQILFGSELKSLLQTPGPKPAIDLKALNDYLSFGYVPDPETIFAGVKKLPPGHILIADKTGANTRRYWELPWPEHSNVPHEDECRERIYELLQEAVKLRLVSEVPLGALLSGGLDSSTVVALMSRLLNRPVKTFSIGFAEEDFSELSYARSVAQRFQTEHHELIVRPQATDMAQSLMGHFDEPFGDPSAIPTYLVSQLARQSITVALSGDGGDELFAGYTRYSEAQRQQFFDRVPRALRRRVLLPLSRRLPHSAYGKRYLRRMGLPDGMARYFECTLIPEGLKEELVSDDFRAQAGRLSSFPELGRAVLNGHGGSLVERIMYLDTVTELPGDILTKVDRMSMAHSLEVRVPLLDHVLVEYVARLPVNYKLRGTTKKYIFKKAFGHLLPEQILNRPKMGFALPLQHWFSNDLKDFLRDVLFDSRAMQRGYFRPAFVDKLVEEHARGRRDHSYLLWSLMALELWHRNTGL